MQISQNPKLTKLNLPMLEAIGGPLIIQNNTALATLESLEHLAAVNATGKIPSVTIPGLQVCCPYPLLRNHMTPPRVLYQRIHLPQNTCHVKRYTLPETR